MGAFENALHFQTRLSAPFWILDFFDCFSQLLFFTLMIFFEGDNKNWLGGFDTP